MSIKIKDKEHLRGLIPTLDDVKEEKSIDLSNFFKNDHPIALDAGCGKGEFLLDKTVKYPGINYLGVDYSWKKCLYTQKKIVDNNIANGFVIRAAFELLFPKFPDNSFDTIYMNFPDPWPKRNHHRRRSLNEWLVAEYARLLKSGGNLYFVTDSFDYAKWAFPKLEANKEFQNQITDGWCSDALDGYFKTIFCNKAEDQGVKINYLKFKRV